MTALPSEADRRRSGRARMCLPPTHRLPTVPLFCNKYIDGMPYLAEIVDLSPTGLLLRTTIEPARQPECFSIELDVPGNPTRIWLWGRTIRRDGNQHAIELVGTELFDRAYLAQLVRWRS